MSHNRIPNENTPNIPQDKSLVDFVFLIFTICGMKEIEVNTPATIPIISV